MKSSREALKRFSTRSGKEPQAPALSVQIVLGIIRGYQVLISPLLGPRCRFYPTCSKYAAEAFSRHGISRGSLLSAKRLLKCHPFHPGGVDPVP